MATYLNNLRLKEIATGDESGTWGTSTNTNLELITDGFSLGTKQMAADANETFTMPDGTADGTRSFFLAFTSAVPLTATRVVTLGPNTISKVWIIENLTTGGQSITIKQGSGTTVEVQNGHKVMVVTDGLGAAADVFLANPTAAAGGTVTSVEGTGTVQGLTLSGTVTSSGNLTLGGSLADVDLTSQVTGTLPIANGGTGTTLTTFVNLTTNVAGILPLANGGTGAPLVDPNADRIFFWDDSAGSTAFLTVGSGLQISGTTLSSTDAGGTVTSVAVSGGSTGLTTSGGPITGSGTITLAGTLAAANGGTGLTAAGASGNVLTSDGTNWVSSAPATGGTVTSVSGTGTVSGLTLTGTVTSSGSLTLGGTLDNINLASGVTGTLPVANGGTGATSLTANNVLLGNGTSAPQTVAPSTSGNVLTSNGSTWVSSPAAGGSGAMEYITSVSIGSPAAAITIDNAAFSSSDYTYLVLSIKNVTLATTASQQSFRFQYRSGGSNQTSSNYDYVGDNTGTNLNIGLLTPTQLGTGWLVSGFFKIYHQSVGFPAQSQILGQVGTGAAAVVANYTNTYDAGIASIGGMQFTTSSGVNFTAGTLTLYGVKNS